MQIGTSLFLLALGAILSYAVNDRINDIDLSTVGLILMVVGGLGLILSLFLSSRVARDDVVVGERRDPLL